MKQDMDWVTISESFDPNLLFKLIEKFVLKQSDNQYKTAVLIAEQLSIFNGKMFKKPPINEMINSLTTLTFVLIL